MIKENLNEIIEQTPGLILKLLDKAGWQYKKIGNVYMGACPVCNRGFKSPNTKFNTDTNSFKCFNNSCGSSGGLKTLSEYLNVDFIEFLKEEGIIKEEKKEKTSKKYQQSGGTKMLNEGVYKEEKKEQLKDKEKKKKIEIDLEKISSVVIDSVRYFV